MKIEPYVLDEIENRIMQVIESLTEKLDADDADITELRILIEHIHVLKRHLQA